MRSSGSLLLQLLQLPIPTRPWLTEGLAMRMIGMILPESRAFSVALHPYNTSKLSRDRAKRPRPDSPRMVVQRAA